MIRQFLLAAFVAAGGASAAWSQGDSGIAFAYAPEQGMGVCTGDTAEAALSCARDRCTESGAAAEDCAQVAWCQPGGWSAGVGIMHNEGIHWTEFTCGWPTKEAAIAAGKVRCEHQDKQYIADCVVAVVYDPDGNEIPIE